MSKDFAKVISGCFHVQSGINAICVDSRDEVTHHQCRSVEHLSINFHLARMNFSMINIENLFRASPRKDQSFDLL